MRITSNANGSVLSQLVNIINQTFPKATDTGLANDLIASDTHADPKSKGKAVFFRYRKTTWRLTENVKVQELDFSNTLSYTPAALEVEKMIHAKLNPVATEAVKELATENIPVPAEVPAIV